jgi:hypothetical protein
MKLVPANELNKNEWDETVRRSGGSVFSLSAYLDATADNWAVLYNDDLSGGVACPFAVKLGVKVLYAPFFHRYTEWIGENGPSGEVLFAAFGQHFPVAEAQFRSTAGDKVFQQLSEQDFHPNQQAKRMLKKASRYTVSEGRNVPLLIALLRRELSPRIASIDDRSLELLERLVENFDESRLIQLNLFDGSEWKGGIWLLPFGGRMLYLKGTVENEAKNNGGMYLLMEQGIRMAFARDLVFDFGGSNAQGVRRFNLNWGAKDVAYRSLRWNNAPLWWKIAKSLRQAWNNRSSS